MSPQQTIAHYRITSKLGEGGMGAVYRATDTKLNREVAIKVLPDSFANDPDRLARFTREAQVLASLNHPNIAQIYGVEDRAIVMELVEGAAPVGPLGEEEALSFVSQLVDALEYAHDKGVVHRDLKPANLRVTPEGQLKVLDFGLAKALNPETATPSGDPTTSPTLTMRATMAGTVMGTAAYMSPEQARGQPVDRRTDIWSFGVVLYELLTGKRLFAGDTVSDTLAAVLKSDPDLSGAPARFQRLLRLCLMRDPRQRLRDISGARLLLDDAPVAPRRAGRLPWIVAAVCAGAALAAGFGWLRVGSGEPALSPIRFSIPLPPGTAFPRAGSATEWVPSPDGRNLAMIVSEKNQTSLWIRPMNAPVAHRVDGTDGADFPFWAPDGQSIGFFTEDSIKRVPVGGGAVVTVCPRGSKDAENDRPDGADWGRDGAIVFGSVAGPLMRVAATGGTPGAVTKLGQKETGHSWPQILPDGRHVLYLARGPETAIYVEDLGSGKRVRVMPSPTRAIWAAPGYLLYAQDGSLLAQRLNGGTFEREGEPVTVAEGVRANEGTGRNTFAISNNGLLVYRGENLPDRQLNWRDRSGKLLSAVGKPAKLSGYGLRLSPDDRTAALIGPGGKVALVDVTSGVLTPLGAAYVTGAPVWSPDSRRLAIAILGTGFEEYTIASGVAKVLGRGLVASWIPEAWSPDGNSLLCRDASSTLISLISLGDRVTARTLFATSYAQHGFSFSPDGNYVAYISAASGPSQVYVASYPSFAMKKRISDDAAFDVVWAAQGKEIIYYSSDHTIVAVQVGWGTELTLGARQPLFQTTAAEHFGVTADGQRLLLDEPLQEKTENALELEVVAHWDAELKKR